MRRHAFLTLPLGLLLSLPAAAQHWNETGPGRDLLSSTVTDFENFRQRAPAPPSFSSTAPAAQGQARGAIPMLDWVPPPPVPAAAPPRRRTTTARRTTPRPAAQDPIPRDLSPMPAAAPAPVASGGQDWERTLAERERELERLRRVLEDDRLRYQQSRQPQLR